MAAVLIIVGVILLIILWFVAIYNGMVKLKISSENAWSDVDVFLKKRYDLIPNLVETVKGYAKYEQETLENVIKARTQAINVKAEDVEKQIQAENMLSQTLRSLFALQERYPDLKANTQFQELMAQLRNIETEIERARRYYNAVVRDFNIKIRVFPNVIVANMTGFSKLPFFEIEDPKERENVKVQF
jgi:LemA protein